MVECSSCEDLAVGGTAISFHVMDDRRYGMRFCRSVKDRWGGSQLVSS